MIEAGEYNEAKPHFQNLSNPKKTDPTGPSLQQKDEVPSKTPLAKSDVAKKTDPTPVDGLMYKGKKSVSPFIAICEFFFSEASYSTFDKIIQYYETELNEPLFALMLKKFFIKFKGRKNIKKLELRKFFYCLRCSKGVTSIFNSNAKATQAPSDSPK